MQRHERVAGFVLVGGESRRMGTDKARLEIDGQPLLLRAAHLLEPLTDSVTLLGPPDLYGIFGLPVLPDQTTRAGPLVAILKALEQSNCEWNVFLACDLPWMESRFISLLIERAHSEDRDAVVARTRDGWQPLCAAYRRTALPKIRRALDEGRSAVVEVLPDLRVEVITTGELRDLGIGPDMFENINDPDSWNRALLRSRARP